VRRAAEEEIGAAAELRLGLLVAAALLGEERARRWCVRSRGSGAFYRWRGEWRGLLRRWGR
jgi:hypothetical protein